MWFFLEDSRAQAREIQWWVSLTYFNLQRPNNYQLARKYLGSPK